MKVLFLCGSLEFGKDGVGDYTRRLAYELTKRGWLCEIISINDEHLSVPVDEIQVEEALNMNVLRLRTAMHWNDRLQVIQQRVDKFNPEWLSLQFVPFSFNQKGLPFKLISGLKNITHNGKWHVMFHELWVGIDKQSSVKYKLWGKLQRNLIKVLLKTANPKVVHTQTRLYQHLLYALDCKAIHLPLFGNIVMNKDRKIVDMKTSKQLVSMVLFGGIHHSAPIRQFSEEAAMYYCKTGCSISLTFIGRSGTEMENWTKEWKSAGLQVKVMGEQSTEVISSILQNADYGIATTPALLIEKSGSVAAMLEHGLPIICVAREWKPAFDYVSDLPDNIYLYTEGSLETIIKNKKEVSNPITVNTVAEQFISDLN